jgi:hypothetical protein
MKTTLAIAALFLVTLAGALWLFGVFTPSPRPVPPTPAERPPPTPPPAPPTEGLQTPAQPEPAEEPAVEIPPFPSPVRILVVTGRATSSFPAWLFQFWKGAPDLSFQTRFAIPPDAGQAEESHSPNLPALVGPPLPEDLDPVRVLVVGEVSPSVAPEEFWRRAAERVRAGTLGLLLLPEMHHGQALAEIPALADLVPVVAARVAGKGPDGAVPGILPTDRPFVATEVGVRHPATRLSVFPNWSRRMWESRREGKGRWSTKFVHPVERVGEGAQVLAVVSSGTQTDAGSVVELPAIVASDGSKGRVLWVAGLFDLGFHSYRDTRSHDLMRALSLHWIAWLAGT